MSKNKSLIRTDSVFVSESDVSINKVIEKYSQQVQTSRRVQVEQLRRKLFFQKYI
jgi:hypothetical protein